MTHNVIYVILFLTTFILIFGQDPCCVPCRCIPDCSNCGSGLMKILQILARK